jgi:hypothetical protein
MTVLGPGLSTATLQQVGSYLGYTFRDACIPREAPPDPDVWSGRASQEVFIDLAILVLHQCIRPLIGAFCAPAIMDISAPAFSLPDRPQMGHLGHQGSQAPGRPILHFVSSSRRPRQGNGAMSSLPPYRSSSFVRAVRPFLRPGLQVVRGIARRGRQGWPSRLPLFPLHRLQAMP